jgi:hypothetical protein
MTRVLVCGAAYFDDPNFVHHTMCEANKTYGPFTCVIHSNHPQALAWQQWVSRWQVTRHLPIVDDPRDGVAAADRCRDRLFVEGRPDIVLVFETADKTNLGRTEKVQKIVLRAMARGIEVHTYIYDANAEKAKKAALKAKERAIKLARKEAQRKALTPSRPAAASPDQPVIQHLMASVQQLAQRLADHDQASA